MALFKERVKRARAWAVPALLCVFGSSAAVAHSVAPEAPGAADAGVPASPPEAPASEATQAPVATDAPPASPEAPVSEGTPPAPADAPVATDTEPRFEAPPTGGTEQAPPAPTEAVAQEPEQKKFESVVVGTSETRTSGSIHVMKPAQLERFEQDDPATVLQSVPGVYARGEDGYGLRPNVGLRGVNPDRSKKVTLLEDGVLFGPAPYSAPAAYYFPLITRMQSVRVLKGPSAIQHGPQTVGGSVEFITRDIPAAESAWLDVAGGAYVYGKAHGAFGASTERAGFLVEGVHLRSSGFKELDGDGHTGFRRNEWMAKGRYLLVPEGPARQSLQLKLGYSDEVSNESYLGLSDEDFRANPVRRYGVSRMDRMENHRTQVVLSHLLESGSLAVTTTAYRQDFDRVWRKVNRFRGTSIADVLADPTSARNAIYYGVLTGELDTSSSQETLLIGPNDRTFVSQGVQSVARWTAETGPVRHSLEVGARYHFDSIERLHTEDAYLVQGGELVRAGEPTATTANNKDSTNAFALHVTDAISWGPLVLTPGVRLEIIRSRSVDRLTNEATSGSLEALMPGVGLFGGVTREIGLFAGVYRGFSPPAPGQPDAVLPEKSINSEAGVRWTRRGERFEVVGFFNDYSNLTDICTFSSGCLDENLDRQTDAGQAHIYGLEAFAEKTFRPGGGLTFPISLSYTLTKTELLEDFQSADPQFGDVRAGDELPYVPRHQVFASAGVEGRLGGVSVSTLFVDTMREEAGQGEVPAVQLTDSVLTFDVNANWNFARWGQLYLVARNVLNEQSIVSRRPYGARPNAPRTVILGLKANL